MYFAVQVVVDYLRYRRVVEPRIGQLEETKSELQARIATSEAELADDRRALDPAKEEVDRLQEEYDDIHRQVSDEVAKQDPPNWRYPDR